MAAKSKLPCCANRISAEKARLLNYVYNYKPQPLTQDAEKDCFSSNTTDTQAGKRPGVANQPMVLCPESKRCCYEKASALSSDQSM